MKITGVALVILGALDLGRLVLTGFGYGQANVVFGGNVFAQHAPWFSTAMGYFPITLTGAREETTAQADLPELLAAHFRRIPAG